MIYTQKFDDLTPAGGVTYGKAETLPSYDIGEALFTVATKFTDEPTVDWWETGHGSASITGTPGDTGLAISSTNKIVFPRPANTVSTVSADDTMTTFMIGKWTPGNQTLMGSDAGTGGYDAIGMNTTTSLRAQGRDSTLTTATSTLTAPANLSTVWTLLFGLFSPTTVQIGYYRTSTGLVLGSVGTKASGTIGNATIPTRIGGYTGNSGTVAAGGILQGTLTVAQLSELGRAASELMASIGEDL